MVRGSAGFVRLLLAALALSTVIACQTVRRPRPPTTDKPSAKTNPSEDQSPGTDRDRSEQFASRDSVKALELAQSEILTEQAFTQALAYESLEDFSHAIDQYQIVIERTGNNSDSRRGRELAARSRLRIARIYRDGLDNPEQAIQYYRDYLEMNPRPARHQEVALELARFYQEQKQFDQARSHYQRLLEQYPDSDSGQSVLYNLGIISMKQDQYKTAIDYFQRLLESHPKGDLADGALFQMARAFSELDLTKQQYDTLLRILQEHPNSDLREYVMFQVVQLGFQVGKGETAQKWAKTYLEEYKEGRFRKDIQNMLDDQS